MLRRSRHRAAAASAARSRQADLVVAVTPDDVEARLFAHVCAHTAIAEIAGDDALGDVESIRFSFGAPDEEIDEQLASARWFVARDPYLVLLDRAVGDLSTVLQMAGVKRHPGKPLSEADKDRLCDYARFSWPGRKSAGMGARISELPPAAELSDRDDLKRRLTAAFNAFTHNPTEANRDTLTSLTIEFCDTRPKRSGKGATVSGGGVDSNRRRH